MAERGVRVTQVYFGNFQPWDSHDDIRIHAKLAHAADGPIAALIDDLKSRGLFDDTLLIIGSEFGRTPMIQNSGLERVCNGRDHNVHGYSLLLAGGGVKGGQAVGKTSKDGMTVEDRLTPTLDLLATVCAILGIDFEKTNPSNVGRPIRIVDKGALPVKEVIA